MNAKPQLVPVASLLFLVGYGLGYALGWPLFFYLPVSGEIHFGPPEPATGPAMGWYGLLALGAVTALLAPLFILIHTRVPWLYGLLPIVLMAYVLFHESHWFLG